MADRIKRSGWGGEFEQGLNYGTDTSLWGAQKQSLGPQYISKEERVLDPDYVSPHPPSSLADKLHFVGDYLGAAWDPVDLLHAGYYQWLGSEEDKHLAKWYAGPASAGMLMGGMMARLGKGGKGFPKIKDIKKKLPRISQYSEGIRRQAKLKDRWASPTVFKKLWKQQLNVLPLDLRKNLARKSSHNPIAEAATFHPKTFKLFEDNTKRIVAKELLSDESYNRFLKQYARANKLLFDDMSTLSTREILESMHLEGINRLPRNFTKYGPKDLGGLGEDLSAAYKKVDAMYQLKGDLSLDLKFGNTTRIEDLLKMSDAQIDDYLIANKNQLVNRFIKNRRTAITREKYNDIVNTAWEYVGTKWTNLTRQVTKGAEVGPQIIESPVKTITDKPIFELTGKLGYQSGMDVVVDPWIMTPTTLAHEYKHVVQEVMMNAGEASYTPISRKLSVSTNSKIADLFNWDQGFDKPFMPVHRPAAEYKGILDKRDMVKKAKHAEKLGMLPEGSAAKMENLRTDWLANPYGPGSAGAWSRTPLGRDIYESLTPAIRKQYKDRGLPILPEGGEWWGKQSWKHRPVEIGAQLTELRSRLPVSEWSLSDFLMHYPRKIVQASRHADKLPKSKKSMGGWGNLIALPRNLSKHLEKTAWGAVPATSGFSKYQRDKWMEDE